MVRTGTVLVGVAPEKKNGDQWQEGCRDRHMLVSTDRQQCPSPPLLGRPLPYHYPNQTPNHDTRWHPPTQCAKVNSIFFL